MYTFIGCLGKSRYCFKNRVSRCSRNSIKIHEFWPLSSHKNIFKISKYSFKIVVIRTSCAALKKSIKIYLSGNQEIFLKNQVAEGPGKSLEKHILWPSCTLNKFKKILAFRQPHKIFQKPTNLTNLLLLVIG